MHVTVTGTQSSVLLNRVRRNDGFSSWICGSKLNRTFDFEEE
jgi:hypothetical protein